MYVPVASNVATSMNAPTVLEPMVVPLGARIETALDELIVAPLNPRLTRCPDVPSNSTIAILPAVPTVIVLVSPTAMRVVLSTSDTP